MNSSDLKNDSYLSIEGVSKKFEQFQAVRHTNLKIRKGEIFCLLGPSGCGKTTLLRMLAGFEQPSEGKIFLDGSELTGIPPFRRPVNMMFQSYAIFPHMTVEQNVAFGLKQDQVAKDKIREKVQEALELVEDQPALRKRLPELNFYMGEAYLAARAFADASGHYARVLELNQSFTREADRQQSLVQKIVRAQPGSPYAKEVALVAEISRADLSALLIEEFQLENLYKRQLFAWSESRCHREKI